MSKILFIGNSNKAQTLNSLASIQPVNLSFKGTSLSSALDKDTVELSNYKLTADDLDSWDNAVSQIARYNYENLASVGNLSHDERRALKMHMYSYRDEEPFLLVSTGGRPAMATYKTPLLEKLSSDFDVVPFCDTSNIILNRKEMIKKIEKNRELFLNRLNLPKETSNKQIYNLFISENGPLYNIINVQDLVGVSFGYPVMDSIIFQLEADSGIRKNIVEQRRNLSEYKKQLLDALYSPNSRYASFDEDFKQKVEKNIKLISCVKSSIEQGYPYGYLYMKFTNNPVEETEIVKNIRKSIQEIEKINQKTENKRFEKDLDMIENSDFLSNAFIKDLYLKYGNKF